MRIQKQIDTIVHIGAGRCGEYEEYKAAGAKRIILIEPDPESARYLRERFAEETETQVMERAIAVTDGPIKLQLYNVRRFSSLREATGLRDLYPGLRKAGEVNPDMWNPRQMCAELSIDSHRFNWLIVDTPGEEGAILEDLWEEGLLEQFEKVSLFSGLKPLYNGDRPVEEILAELGEMGYEEMSRDDANDTERPRWDLYRDEVKVRNRELEQKVDVLVSQKQDLEEQTAAQAQELSKLKDELEAVTIQKSTLEKNLNDVREELEKDRQLRKKLEAERDDLAGKNEKLASEKQDLDKRSTELNEHNRELQIRQAKINEELIKGIAQIDLIKELLLPQFNEGYKIDK
jgi:FkbM family methyltransferase